MIRNKAKWLGLSCFIMSASLIASALPALAADLEPVPPGPIEHKMIELLLKKEAFRNTKESARKQEEIQRAREIAEASLKLTEEIDAQESLPYYKRVESVRSGNKLKLSHEEIINLTTNPDSEERLAIIKSALGDRKVSKETLKRIDDDLFWATLDNGKNATSEEFKFKDGSGIAVELDPETREGLVNVYDSGEESGLPLDVVLPTRWKKAVEDKNDTPIKTQDPEAGNNTLKKEKPSVATILPEVDDSVPPSVMTEEDFKLTFNTIIGMWEINNELWHINVSGPLDGDVVESKEDLQVKLTNIEKAINAAQKGSKIYVWKNVETGEIRKQERYRPLNASRWQYEGEQNDTESPETLKELEEQKKLIESRLQSNPGETSLDPTGFKRLSSRASAITIRVLRGEQCPFDYTRAYFDGRTLGAELIHYKKCTLNQSLPGAIQNKLLSGGYARNNQAILRVTSDPRANVLRLKGQDWGRQVHYNGFDKTTINSVSNLKFEKNLNGQQPTGEDLSYLTDSAMGADENVEL